jgi:hypothetical protein
MCARRATIRDFMRSEKITTRYNIYIYIYMYKEMNIMCDIIRNLFCELYIYIDA